MKTKRSSKRGGGGSRKVNGSQAKSPKSRKGSKSKQMKISSVLKNSKRKLFSGSKSEVGSFKKENEVVEVEVSSGSEDVTEVTADEMMVEEPVSTRTRADTKKQTAAVETEGRRRSMEKSAPASLETPRHEQVKVKCAAKSDHSFRSVAIEKDDHEKESTIRKLSDAEKEEILQGFDLNPAYGPCRGITRLERLQRAYRYRFVPEPPSLVAPILKKFCAVGRFNSCIWDQRLTI